MKPRERLEPQVFTPLERQLLVTEQQKRPNIQALPNSSVLSKLKTFLPQMQQANAELQQKLQACDPAEVDIEHIPEASGTNIIQMDLACGLLELKDGAAVAAAQRAIAAGSEVAVEAYDGGSSSSDSDTDSEDNSGSRNDESVTLEEPLERDRNSCDDALHSSKDGDSIQQQQQGGAPAGVHRHQQNQQGLPGQRRKVKAKRPMIVEMPSG